MKILLDKEAIEEVVKPLGLRAKDETRINLTGWQCIHNDKAFYFEKKHSNEEIEYIIVDLEEKDVWQLDKFLTPINYKKEMIQKNDEEIYIYVLRELHYFDNMVSFEQIKRNIDNKELQMKFSDIYLLIPGKLEKDEDVWDKIGQVNNSFFNCFKQNIDNRVREEYNSEFAKKIDRKCVSEVVLKINDLTDKQIYEQKAVVALAKHDTGLCVIEIIVPNCNIGGNKLLNYYCGNQLMIKCDNNEYTISEYCKKIHVRQFGKKRSLVFSYGEVSKQEIINALANEEFPMGKIGGIFEQKVQYENIAQYDTAEVYVSNETMLEKCNEFNNICENRLEYHSIEIFFVELILFQDAAIDKVYYDLNQEEDRQRGYIDVKTATEKYEQLSFDMAQAIRFGDYEQFCFPTTRISAKNVAKSFGIQYIFEKYNTNKELLQAMIEANKRRMQEKQDEIKNRFLLLISAIATIGTLGDIIYAIFSDYEGGSLSYAISAIVVLGGYVIYEVFRKIHNDIYILNYKKDQKK